MSEYSFVVLLKMVEPFASSNTLCPHSPVINVGRLKRCRLGSVARLRPADKCTPKPLVPAQFILIFIMYNTLSLLVDNCVSFVASSQKFIKGLGSLFECIFFSFVYHAIVPTFEN